MSATDKQHLFQQLQAASEQLKSKLKQYGAAFSQQDFFTFSGSEERKKQYTNAYKRLSLDMPLLVAEIEQICAELAGLLIAADRAADAELAERLNSIFFAHTAFEEILSEFVENSERELASPAPSPTALNTASNKLVTALENLNAYSKV